MSGTKAETTNAKQTDQEKQNKQRQWVKPTFEQVSLADAEMSSYYGGGVDAPYLTS